MVNVDLWLRVCMYDTYAKLFNLRKLIVLDKYDLCNVLFEIFQQSSLLDIILRLFIRLLYFQFLKCTTELLCFCKLLVVIKYIWNISVFGLGIESKIIACTSKPDKCESGSPTEDSVQKLEVSIFF